MHSKVPVYLDFDNTLTNSTKVLVYFLNKHYDKNKNYKDIKKYDCKDLFPKVTHKLILDIFDRKEFFTDLEFFPLCRRVLIKYKNNFDYQITTIGTKNNLLHKQKYLKESFPCEYVFNGIEKVGMGKEMIDMSDGIIIDDHIDNIRSSNARYKILYKGELDTEWNECKEDNLCFVARNWNEVDEILQYIKILEDTNCHK